MNNEELIKDETILQLVKHVEMKFGKQVFRIKDYWDADLFAIGFSDPLDKCLLYVSTRHQQENKYYVGVEIENVSSNEASELVQESENVTLQELENMFIKYFSPKTM